jgi:hypothetical protein
MACEDRISRALEALAAPRQAFRAALVAAIDELTGILAEQRAPAATRAVQEASRLGAFGSDRMDVALFSSIVASRESIEPAQLDQLEHALRILRSFAAQGEELFVLRMRRGADLRDAVRDALAARGRAFNTAHQVELLRATRAGLQVDLDYGTLDFRHWTRRERSIAPPLVVELFAGDAQPAALADYLDGSQKIVLVVDGRLGAAPLVRLLAPGTFVAQTNDPADILRLASFDGPGIVALVADDAPALFVHDPSRGRRLRDRLEVRSIPARTNQRVGGISARRQAEELDWLEELNRLADAEFAGVPADAVPERQVTPADQLAAWLLRQGTGGEE